MQVTSHYETEDYTYTQNNFKTNVAVDEPIGV